MNSANPSFEQFHVAVPIPNDNMTRTISFAPMPNQPPPQSLAIDKMLFDMASPIANSRRDLKDPTTLNDEEQEVLDLFCEFRENDYLKDFSTYKNYYQDAFLQNMKH